MEETNLSRPFRDGHDPPMLSDNNMTHTHCVVTTLYVHSVYPGVHACVYLCYKHVYARTYVGPM